MGGSTNAFYCIKYSDWAHMKMCGGMMHLKLFGDTLEGAMGDHDQGRQKLANAVRDILPWADKRYAARNQSQMDFAAWISHRARECIPSELNELQRFRAPAWRSSWNLISNAVEAGDVSLHLDQVYEAQEARIEAEIADLAGVYFRLSSSGEYGYLGKASNLSKRGDGHLNSSAFLYHVWVTPLGGQTGLEGKLLRSLSDAGAVPTRRGRRTKGLFTLPSRFDPDQWIKTVSKDEAPLFYNTVR